MCRNCGNNSGLSALIASSCLLKSTGTNFTGSRGGTSLCLVKLSWLRCVMYKKWLRGECPVENDVFDSELCFCED
jgi:hypothetical protein